MARESIEKYSRRKPDPQVLDKLLEQVRYVPGTFDDDSVYERLDEQLKEFDKEAGIEFNRLFYLSTSPDVLPGDRRQARRARPQPPRARPRCAW